MKIYNYTKSAFPGIEKYYFTTEKNTSYEVSFAKKQDTIFSYNVVFGVINDEFKENEYVETNKGEMYSVMNTIVQIIQQFIAKKDYVKTLEFIGMGGSNNKSDIKNNLYIRYIKKLGLKYEPNQNQQKIIVHLK